MRMWVVLPVLLLAACSSAAPAPAPSPSPVAVGAVDACAGAEGWTTVAGASVPAAQIGAGRTVVFANDSGNQPCDFLTLGRQLAAAGLRAVVWTYDDMSEAQETTDLLTLAGTGPYGLVGASAGGRLVIEAAARHPAGLAAIVSLSGEREIDPGYPDILPQARQVSTPCLYVGTTLDAYTDGTRQSEELHDAMRGRPNELLELPGVAHGVDLLALNDPAGVPIPDRILAFLKPFLT
jgi:hypothetical protein